MSGYMHERSDWDVRWLIWYTIGLCNESWFPDIISVFSLCYPCHRGYVFSSFGLFVCMSVSNITQKVMNRLR